MSSSSSNDYPLSREERTSTTASGNLPPGQRQYEPFRRSSHLTSTPYDPFAGGRVSQTRRSPSGSANLLFEVVNPYDPPLPTLQPPLPPSTTESISYSARDPSLRSAPDESLIGIRPISQESHGAIIESPPGNYPEYESEAITFGSYGSDTTSATPRYHHHPPRGRNVGNRDEFDGPSQLLPLPLPQQEQSRAGVLPRLPVHLTIEEQDEVARWANEVLAQCAFHFVAKYQFPIPVERDKPRVRQPSDREWTEWAYLLKRLATKRRIPARVLFDGQIKQFVTTLENSIAVRQTPNVRSDQPTPRQPRDDRYMLQLISSGLQVAKILMDSVAMEQLNQLYLTTETIILERRSRISSGSSGVAGVGGGGGGGGVGVIAGSGRGSIGVRRASQGGRGAVGSHSMTEGSGGSSTRGSGARGGSTGIRGSGGGGGGGGVGDAGNVGY